MFLTSSVGQILGSGPSETRRDSFTNTMEQASALLHRSSSSFWHLFLLMSYGGGQTAFGGITATFWSGVWNRSCYCSPVVLDVLSSCLFVWVWPLLVFSAHLLFMTLVSPSSAPPQPITSPFVLLFLLLILSTCASFLHQFSL